VKFNTHLIKIYGGEVISLFDIDLNTASFNIFNNKVEVWSNKRNEKVILWDGSYLAPNKENYLKKEEYPQEYYDIINDRARMLQSIKDNFQNNLRDNILISSTYGCVQQMSSDIKNCLSLGDIIDYMNNFVKETFLKNSMCKFTRAEYDCFKQLEEAISKSLKCTIDVHMKTLIEYQNETNIKIHNYSKPQEMKAEPCEFVNIEEKANLLIQKLKEKKEKLPVLDLNDLIK